MDAAQEGLPGIPEAEALSMIARVSALAIKTVYAFTAKKDIRIYLTGVNIRPIEGGVMLIATDGHRFVVMRDPNGYAEREMVLSVNKDGAKPPSARVLTPDQEAFRRGWNGGIVVAIGLDDVPEIVREFA